MPSKFLLKSIFIRNPKGGKKEFYLAVRLSFLHSINSGEIWDYEVTGVDSILE